MLPDGRGNILTPLEQTLLDTIQDAFPLEERPYRVLTDVLNGRGEGETVTEQAVFEAVENLRNSGIVRRIGGIYDSQKLGFISRLCAGKVSDVDKFATAVNGIPAITHNYVRSHEYNVWFTVIAESEGEIRAVVEGLCSTTDLHDVHILAATKKFKINTVMGKGADERNEDFRDSIGALPLQNDSGNDDRGVQFVTALSSSDRARIRIACGDIPHSLTPFADWGVPIEALRDDLAQKRMRRFGAILRHQDAGFAFNAMVCFDAPGSAGDVLAQKPYVSHCYERPSFEGFPYTLYAMMHAQSAAELETFIKGAAESIGSPDYVVLHSLRELKKTSFDFFA
ncbi:MULTISPECIES: Lrp/AsnC family transcriptional regulator [unclassified Fibrobacter]|uniref:Lrp/AsnC family transcriptional regulator n=1 Tax=unclassified Fibrobacter TaxID=2634177 RepID=UPI0025C41D51|nr:MULTISPECIES: Lrp/AsnC family transcriptional regulator [unclassified Fibrobacter]